MEKINEVKKEETTKKVVAKKAPANKVAVKKEEKKADKKPVEKKPAVKKEAKIKKEGARKVVILPEGKHKLTNRTVLEETIKGRLIVLKGSGDLKKDLTVGELRKMIIGNKWEIEAKVSADEFHILSFEVIAKATTRRNQWTGKVTGKEAKKKEAKKPEINRADLSSLKIG